ncbi:MAG: AEC family transporter [Clostridia bacterium]|nr:AEC family transporter [Clostridia bacterium]
MVEIIVKVVTIFSMIGIGYVLNRNNILPKEANDYLIKLLLLVFAPCMCLQAMAAAELNDKIFSATMETIIFSAIYVIIAMGVGYLLIRKFKEKLGDNASVYMALFTGMNSGFMGFPVTKAVFGDQLFYFMVIQNIVLNLYLYVVMPIQLSFDEIHNMSLKKFLRSFINMCTIAAFIGMIMLFSGHHFPDAVDNWLKMIGDATIPVSMIVVGVELGQSKIREIVKNKILMLTILAKQFAMPALTFLLVNWLPISVEAKITVIFAACFPPAVVTVAMSYQEGKDSTIAAQGVAFGSLISMATISLCAMFIKLYYLS